MIEHYINHNKGKRPNISLMVQRVEPTVWTSLGFDKHHYLTSTLNPSCKCLLFTWNSQPVAFAALLNTPRKGIPYGMSISRIVVLPDFQGLGLSSKICDFCGGIVKSLSDSDHDYRLYIKTAHRKMGEGLSRNPKWRGTAFDGKSREKDTLHFESGKYNNRLSRKSYCKEYVGDPIYGYQDLLKSIKEMRDKRAPSLF